MLLDVSPWGAKRTLSKQDGQYVITQTADISAVLDENVANYNDGIHRGEDNTFWHMARVPLDVLEMWLREYTKATGRLLFSPFADDEHWNTWVFARLNSSEYRKLRTSPGRI